MFAGWLMIVVAVAAPPDVTLSPMQGNPLAGALLELSAERVVLETAAGRRTFESRDLLQLRPQRQFEVPPPEADQAGLLVRLVDGSLLPAAALSVASGRAVIELERGGEVKTSTRAIHWARFNKQSAPLRAQWREITAVDRTADAIVIRKSREEGAGGAVEVALDFLEGLLQDIDGQAVGFEFGGADGADRTHVDVPREKVEGVIYYHPPARSPSDPVCRVVDTAGAQWNVRSLKLSDSQLELISAAGVRHSLPLERLDHIDYSIGNIDYLSDLPRESVVWKPRRRTAITPSTLQWFHPKFDAALYGGSLQLGGETYAKGLAAHSHAEITYRLTKPYRRLLATVGIDDEFRFGGNLELQIVGDNRPLFQRSFSGEDDVFELDLDVRGVRRLKIVVAFGDDDSDEGDTLNLCNARLTK